MKSIATALLASVVLIAGIGAGPAAAGGLLGGLGETLGDTVNEVTNTVTETVGNTVDTVTGGDGTNVGNIISLNEEDDPALVNLDLGSNGTNGNVLSASVGGTAGVGVSTNGLLSTTTVSLDLAGLGLDLEVDLGILDPNSPNNPGNPGGNPNNPVLVGSLGGGGTFVINCTVNNSRQVLQVAAAGKITAAEIKAWRRSANVQIVPIKLCPAAKKQVAAILAKSQKINLLRRAVVADNLIAASLSRTRYDANDVVAVQRKGGQLVVYVF